MLDAQAILLMHPHDDHAAPMTELRPGEGTDQDEERVWLRGGRIFRCTECNEQVVVGPSKPSGSEASGR